MPAGDLAESVLATRRVSGQAARHISCQGSLVVNSSTEKHWLHVSSDASRLAIIWKYGGIYLDTDVISIRPIPEENFLAAQGSQHSSNGVFGFLPHHPFLWACMENFVEHYSSSIWGNQGPLLMTRMLRVWCRLQDFQELGDLKCLNISFLHPQRFYPIPYPQWRRYYQVWDTEPSFNDSYGLHLWNFMNKEGRTVVRGSNTLVENLYRKHCPKTYKVLIQGVEGTVSREPGAGSYDQSVVSSTVGSYHQVLKLKALQSYSMTESHLGSLRDEESEERLKQAQELQALREKMEVQKTEWKRKMKALHEERAAERREMREENERLHATLSQDQKKAAAQSQRHINALRAQLQEQAKLIASQEETIQTLSLRKVEEVQEVPKAMDTEEDSSEEELQSSRGEQWKVLASLRQNPTWLKQFRPILEDTLEEKLEGMGIKRNTKGISAQTLQHLESLLRTQREQTARSFREFLSLREKLNKEVTSRVKKRWESTGVVSQPDSQPPVKSQQITPATREARPKTRTLNVALPSKPAEPSTPALQRHSSHGPGLTQVSTPIPRPRVHGPSSTPVSPGPGLSTPPFSSEEEPEEDLVQRVSLQPPKVLPRSAAQPENSWGWSDSETSEESVQPPGKGSSGLASSGTLVQSMVKNLEKQLETPVKKPSGGVSVFLRPNTALQKSSTPARKSQLSEDESDLEISSLEDLSQDLDQRGKPKPLSHSKLPEKLDASPWSSGRPRVPGWRNKDGAIHPAMEITGPLRTTQLRN
ncbi:zinc finger protein DZIP1L [Cricetulus griseus]|uniref:Zinc finger protein DZIP1L n=1 Tax=Cricetulus griseus TaxID=10029 RepID=A0A061IBU8_CRIGR|nr:zinc finger protein DZIP1L [Cricetulus griseus]